METIFIFVAIICFLACLPTIKWQKLVISALVLLIFEGVLRKWVLPQASDAIYFLKDILLLAAYISYYSNLRRSPVHVNKKFNQTFTLLIYFVFAICFIQSFNPSLGSVFIGLFGTKNYLFYIPLVWMIPNLFNSKEELYKFLRLYLLLTIPVCILAIAQFFSPPNSPINVYAAGSTAGIATFGVGGEDGAVRVTGTFPYISGLGCYLSASLTLIIPLLSTQQALRWQIITIVEAFLVIVSSFMTGSRAVVYFAGVYFMGYLIVLFFNKKRLFDISFKRFIIPTIIIFILTTLFFNKSVDLFTQRTVANETEGYTRILSPLIDPWLLPLRLDGYGTGASHQATPKLREVLGVNLENVELPPPNDGSSIKVMIDLGPMGLILWESLRLYLLLVLWNTFKKLQDPLLIQLALSILLFSIIQFTAPLVSNPTLSLYYWFFIGFIFLLPQLDGMKDVLEGIPNARNK